jgi:hypothetical protein
MKPDPASKAIRMTAAAPALLAHLRALIRQWPVQSIQRQQLAMLLRDELTVWARASQRFGRYRYLKPHASRGVIRRGKDQTQKAAQRAKGT